MGLGQGTRTVQWTLVGCPISFVFWQKHVVVHTTALEIREICSSYLVHIFEDLLAKEMHLYQAPRHGFSTLIRRELPRNGLIYLCSETS